MQVVKPACCLVLLTVAACKQVTVGIVYDLPLLALKKQAAIQSMTIMNNVIVDSFGSLFNRNQNKWSHVYAPYICHYKSLRVNYPIPLYNGLNIQ